MIATKLIGGLGNQLFQYAIALHLGKIHNTEVLIDNSEFESYTLHKYALADFNINENYASKGVVNKMNIHSEKTFYFDPKFKEISDNVLLSGYWQSEKYFLDIKDVIIQTYSVKKPLFGLNAEISKSIQSTNSISIHIRRTDYLPNTYNDQVLEFINLGYYESAIQEISTKINNPFFYIFSDDPSWVKSNLNIQFPHIFIDNNKENAYEDLRLMSLCNNNIIANSSFSWWGAWLNKHNNKIIIAPKQWFSKNAKNLDSCDLIPDNWVRI